jgi:hypothetical protein
VGVADAHHMTPHTKRSRSGDEDEHPSESLSLEAEVGEATTTMMMIERQDFLEAV